MRREVRTLAVGAPALIVVAVAWLRLEQPVGSVWSVFLLLLLALAAALPRGRWMRGAAAVVATVIAARVAVGVDLVPWRFDGPGSFFGLSDSFSTLGTRFGNGFDDFYSTHLPFDPRVHTAMHELVLSGIFVFALGVTLLVAARKPIAASLVLLLGAGWPATLLGPSGGIAMGAAILFGVLVLLAGLGSRRVPAFALPAAVVVAVAAVVVGSATAARHGLVQWQTWNLAHVATGPTDVGFVWNAQYGGLQFSGHPTTVLQVQSSQAPTYLRATVLEDFNGAAWEIGLPRPGDSLEPAAAKNPENQTPEVVTVDALADTHLVGGSIPMRFVAAGGAPLIRSGPGFASLDQNLPQGFRYTAWSYTRRPTPAQLRRSPASYPSEIARGMLGVDDGVTVPPFGTPNRVAQVLTVAREHDIGQYLPLARLALRQAGAARTPYDAVEKLEQWFVSSGTFRYSNHPPVVGPPLVGFVTVTHAGYCQYFAGAMALMLRYLGIPARVAVGFAGGTYDSKQHIWDITDREAHAWVEVWFKGYGWVPFDPTPAAPGAAPRHTLAGVPTARRTGGGGTTSSARGKGSAAKDSTPAEQKLNSFNGFAHGAGQSQALSVPVVGGGGGTDRSGPLLLLLAGIAVLVAAVVLTKIGFRVSRSRRRDPRGVAAACRKELTAFLVDQRVETPRSATLGELGELLRREFAVQPEAFVAAATAARFGPPGEAATAAVTAKHELRSILEIARRSLTWRDRARGLLSLRSLTRPVAT